MPVPPRRRRFGGRRRPSDTDHGLPKPIRRRRPPFLLRVDARASAVRSSALAGRERAPMTQATSSSLYRLQTWQHEAEAVHGLQGSHAYCNREGRRSALAVVALRDARRCLSSTTTRDRCAGRRFTCRRRNHDVHGRPRRTGHATNLHDSDGAAAAGRRGIDVKLLDAQVLPSRNTPCIVWNTLYLQRWVALEVVDLPAARG